MRGTRECFSFRLTSPPPAVPGVGHRRVRLGKKNSNNGREQKSHRFISLDAAAEICAHTQPAVDDLTTRALSSSPLSLYLSLSRRRTVVGFVLTLYIILYIILLYCREHLEYNPFKSSTRQRRKKCHLLYAIRRVDTPINMHTQLCCCCCCCCFPPQPAHDFSPVPRLMNPRIGRRRWKKSK